MHIGIVKLTSPDWEAELMQSKKTLLVDSRKVFVTFQRYETNAVGLVVRLEDY